MNQKEYNALQRIVDYLYADEQKHWEESGKPKKHIFLDVMTLNDILYEMKDRGLIAKS